MKFTEQTIGKWTILKNSYTDKYGRSYITCRCNECNAIKDVMKSKILDGSLECDSCNCNERGAKPFLNQKDIY